MSGAPVRKHSSPLPDLRLVGVAAGTWLSALGCLYLAALPAALLAAAAALLAAGLGSVRRLGSPRWLVAAVLLGVVCGAAATAARLAVRDAAPLAGLARQRATVQVGLTIVDDPRPVGGIANGPQTYLVPASVTTIETRDGRHLRLDAGMLVFADDPAWRALLPGTSVRASGRLSPPDGGDLTAAVLSVSTAPDRIGTAPWAQRAAGALRTGLRRACAPLPPGPGGLLPGLVDGDTGRLDPAVADDFRATGMTHLVAVSGANVAILLGAVLLLARWCRAGPWLAAALCTVALVGFVILARPSPSVLRAAAMGGLGLLALVSGRPRAAVPGLAATVMVLVVASPALAADPGFALSVFATGGLLLLAPRWRDALRRHRVPAGLAEALAIPAAAEVACAPVIAAISGTVSLVAVPANLLAEPAVAPATVLGVVAASVSTVWPAAAEFLAWLASWPARWLVSVARFGAATPSAVVGWPGGASGGLLLALILLVGLLAARRPAVRVVVGACAVAAALGAVPVAVVAGGWPPVGALMVACDVGQGDSVVLPLGGARAVVVDAGPEPTATDRCLRELGVREVSLFIVSHFHADHVGGVDGVFRGRRVDEVAIGWFPEPAAGRQEVLGEAARRGTPVVVPELGWQWVEGPLALTVLGPVGRVTGTDSDPNNNSLIVMAHVHGIRMLLPGDAEVQEQAAVLAADGPGALRAQVLKVAHHGSAYQDPALLEAVHPAVALVSVGVGNPYGHPNLPMLGRLQREGARVLRTDLDGDVAAVLDRGRLATVRHGVAPGRRPP
ncbi:ComEC/Rec2 family competence protein [Rugosimonospora africana]|uniref:Competence protein ComEC n=1 Tax=Rugosimonospora africana TaxID=556532 RepID=A0A8J3R197_9ACTN|nr:ComEC/Rec2 family competence protein [Rugosimonospora africana]GIH19979.1 competence protein ComEC [Rugosimonospora africana]